MPFHTKITSHCGPLDWRPSSSQPFISFQLLATLSTPTTRCSWPMPLFPLSAFTSDYHPSPLARSSSTFSCWKTRSTISGSRSSIFTFSQLLSPFYRSFSSQ
uniref:Uncharacterized protein n=1 Tax=Cacopsylla melanoneura TaxID=428564 RepID=A0A8D9A0I2_9HEMI